MRVHCGLDTKDPVQVEKFIARRKNRLKERVNNIQEVNASGSTKEWIINRPYNPDTLNLMASVVKQVNKKNNFKKRIAQYIAIRKDDENRK